MEVLATSRTPKNQILLSDMSISSSLSLAKFKAKGNSTLESVCLSLEQLKEVVIGYVPLLTKIFCNNLIIPEFQTFCDTVKRLYNQLADNFEGEVWFPRNTVSR